MVLFRAIGLSSQRRPDIQNHIAPLLEEGGYATQLICDCPHLFNSHFNAGFQAAFQHRGQEGDKPLLHLNDPIQTMMPADKTRLSPSFKGHSLVDVHCWTNRYAGSGWINFPSAPP